MAMSPLIIISSFLLLLLVANASSARSLFSSSPAAAYKPFRPYWKDKQATISMLQESRKPDSTGGAAAIFAASKAFEGSSEYVKMRYHMGPVLTQPMHIYILWYGSWKPSDKSVIRDFLSSVSEPQQQQQHEQKLQQQPSVSSWWSTVRLYTDQTLQNITNQLVVAGEHDAGYSHGHSLTRLTMQEVLKSALSEGNNNNNNTGLPVNPRRGIYLILTAGDVVVQDFCRAVCGFHYFSFPSIVGYTLPYAWVGHSERQCPEVCAYPFAVPSYMAHTQPMKPPNGNAAVDGMVSVIAHELAEISSNPLINAWYAGEDPTAPTEIADLCEGMYGTGAGGGYAGEVLTDAKTGVNYNMRGVNGRRFLVQWIWDPMLSACHGPNASD